MRTYTRKRIMYRYYIKEERDEYTHTGVNKATHRVIYIYRVYRIPYTPSPNKGNEEKPR